MGTYTHDHVFAGIFFFIIIIIVYLFLLSLLYALFGALSWILVLTGYLAPWFIFNVFTGMIMGISYLLRNTTT